MSKIKLPDVPKPSNAGAINEYSRCDMLAYAYAAVRADRAARELELEEVCAEAYQVVGSLLSDLDIFETDYARKIMDNLSEGRCIHDDVLPWPSFT